MIPEIRTTRATAIGLSVATLGSLTLAVLGAEKLEKGLDSETGATALLAAWCVAGVAAAIAAIVDAWVRPEGERLGLGVTIAGTVFGVLGLVAVVGIVIGFANVTVNLGDL